MASQSSAVSVKAQSSQPLANLLPWNWKSQIQSWLAEDAPSFDVGGFVVGDTPKTASLFLKASVAFIKIFILYFGMFL